MRARRYRVDIMSSNDTLDDVLGVMKFTNDRLGGEDDRFAEQIDNREP